MFFPNNSDSCTVKGKLRCWCDAFMFMYPYVFSEPRSLTQWQIITGVPDKRRICTYFNGKQVFYITMCIINLSQCHRHQSHSVPVNGYFSSLSNTFFYRCLFYCWSRITFLSYVRSCICISTLASFASEWNESKIPKYTVLFGFTVYFTF